MIQTLKKQYDIIKMPLFWKNFSLSIILAVSLVFLLFNEFWANIFYPICGLLISIGMTAGIKRQKLNQKLWHLLLIAIYIFELSITLHSLSYFKIIADFQLAFWLKEGASVLTVSFVIGLMLIVEKSYRLKGLVLDFSLLTLSFACYVFIANTNYLNIFLYKLSTTQQLYLINLFFTIVLILMGLVLLILNKKNRFKTVSLMFMLALFAVHLFLEFSLTFPHTVNNRELVSKASWFFFQVNGGLIIFYTFLEDLDFSNSQQVSSKVSQIFMWSASTLAISVIPVVIFTHWFNEDKSVIYLVAAIASLTLGSIIIWRFILLIRDSNKQRNRLLSIAYTDDLTGVLNYRGCSEKYALKASTNSLVVAINIEDFKSINDFYGRNFGDEVLKTLASKLTKLEDVIIVARTGSDTFMTVFEVAENNVKSQLLSLQKELGVWNNIMGKTIAVPLTFGASHSVERANPETLATQAEKALKMARNKHLSLYQYSNDIEKQCLPRHELRAVLQQAIDTNYLPVHFQPIYNIETGDLKALELLIRVDSKDHGLLMPAQFLKQAMAYDLLTPLTEVCINMVAKNYENLPKATININLPSYMLDNPTILEDFLTCFKKTGLEPQRFCLEIMEDEEIPVDDLISSVKLLRKQGFAIAMDDFGVGHSSLSRLSMLPVDTVKIDRSLLLAASTGNKAILETAITLIKRLGLASVVEGVETQEQLKLVQLLGADLVQGFLFSKPVHVCDVKSILPNVAV